MQKSSHFLDHYLICYDFLKMQMKNEIKIEQVNEIIGIIGINLNYEIWRHIKTQRFIYFSAWPIRTRHGGFMQPIEFKP